MFNNSDIPKRSCCNLIISQQHPTFPNTTTCQLSAARWQMSSTHLKTDRRPEYSGAALVPDRCILGYDCGGLARRTELGGSSIKRCAVLKSEPTLLLVPHRDSKKKYKKYEQSRFQPGLKSLGRTESVAHHPSAARLSWSKGSNICYKGASCGSGEFRTWLDCRRVALMPPAQESFSVFL